MGSKTRQDYNNYYTMKQAAEVCGMTVCELRHIYYRGFFTNTLISGYKRLLPKAQVEKLAKMELIERARVIHKNPYLITRDILADLLGISERSMSHFEDKHTLPRLTYTFYGHYLYDWRDIFKWAESENRWLDPQIKADLEKSVEQPKVRLEE